MMHDLGLSIILSWEFLAWGYNSVSVIFFFLTSSKLT